MNNGYTQIEIDGNVVGIKFGLPALRMLLEKAIEFPNIWNDNTTFNEAGWAYMLYFGYINNCMLKEMSPVFKFEIFMDYVEDVADDAVKSQDLKNAISIWGKSREVIRLVEKAEGKEKKNQSNGDSMSLNHIATAPLE